MVSPNCTGAPRPAPRYAPAICRLPPIDTPRLSTSYARVPKCLTSTSRRDYRDSVLQLTRDQVLAGRRRIGSLDERLEPGPQSLQQAAWAGLQDSMPRAALLSLHARVNGTTSSALEDPRLVQLWGPRFSVFVVSAADRAIFSLGLLPDTSKGRQRAEYFASRLREITDVQRPTVPCRLGALTPQW